MPQKVRIALDAMGGDHGPSVVVPGAEVSLTRHPDIEFVLFGDQAVIGPLLDARPRPQAGRAPRAHRRRGQDGRQAEPSVAPRAAGSPPCGLRIDAVKKGEADVAVSAGNTGALMAMAKFNLKTMAGIEPPGDRRPLADAARRVDRA